MDFVKREDHNLVEEDQYKTYLENLQKTHQMDSEYHTPITMEQLHQAMQTSLNASSLVHNFQLPLSPRQMSTLMLKTNHLSRNLNFNEIPAHLPRNLSADIDLVQNLAHEIPQNLGRPEDLILSHNLTRNLDLTLARNLSNDLDLQSSLAQSLVQNLTEQDIARNLSNDLNQNLNRIEVLTHELDLSHHLNRQNIEQEILSQERRTPMGVDNLREQMLSQRLDQNLGRVVNQVNLHEQRLSENEQLLPMPFHIKSEQDDDGYMFYDSMNHNINVNGLNGHNIVTTENQAAQNIQDNQMYVYAHQTIIPPLNSIDLYSRPQNFVQNFDNNRDNPQNLVVNRQFESNSYDEQFKKFDSDAQNGGKKEEPKENLKPTDQNKMFYSEYNNQVFQEKSEDSNENKLVISEDTALIKGEYLCYKCHEIFPTKRGIKQHFKVCSSNGVEADEKQGKFSCSQCTYKCQSPAILKIHERVHSGEKPFSCTFCDYKSGQKNNVAKHILVHMKAKPFSCQYCDYKCAQKNNLVVHERTHTGFKPFACPYCDYRTVQKPNLVKHMYLHTDQKPFSCDQCSYRCVQKTNLTKHKQRHLNEKVGDKTDVKTQNKPYRPRQKSVKCPHCSYKCVQKSSLEKHMQFKHSDVPDPSQMAFVEIGVNEDSVQNLSVKKSEAFDAEDKVLQVQS